MKFSIKTIITVIILVLFIFGGGGIAGTVIHNLKTELKEQVNLRNSLIDSIDTYKNERDELVSEKLTLQTTVKQLEEINTNLTGNQKELLQRVKQTKKQNDILTAALIEYQIILDSLKNGIVYVNENDTSLLFSLDTDYLVYRIKVTEAIPSYELAKPELIFENFRIPNKQFITFQWKDNKKEGYPISFSVSNTNPYINVYNIDSYAIPELKKQEIKPNFWKKIGNFIKGSENKTIWVAIGAAATLIITK